MFAVRGMIVSLAVFAVVYSAMSFAVVLTWRRLWAYGKRSSASRRADLLFVLRMIPLISATLLTGAFAVPSFLMFEPRQIEERIGAVPLVAALLGLAVVIFGLGNGIRALTHAWRMVRTWTRGSRPIHSGIDVRVLQTSEARPAMTLAGIVRPTILLSDAARSLLSPSELHAALNHELAHVARWDNFRKLLLQFIAFPGMSELEAEWVEATEIAADDRAVAHAGEALDLASALIKLSRFTPLHPPLELTAALVHTPASLVNARVNRLIAWKEEARTRRGNWIWPVLSAGGATLSILAFGYGPLLAQMHAMTEWLVR